MSLSRKETEDLKPLIEKAVNKFLGFSEPTLLTAAVNCLDKGYDKRKTVEKLSVILDNSQASTFTEKLFNVYDDFRSSSRDKGRKRKVDADDHKYEDEPKKMKKVDDSKLVGIPEPIQPSPAQMLSADKVKEMLANAQKAIKERKAQLNVSMMPLAAAVPNHNNSTTYASQQLTNMAEHVDKARRGMELKARIESRLSGIRIGGVGLETASQLNQPTGPTPVILDEEGRTIDVKTGQAIQLQHHQPTLKANIRAKKREQFKAVHERPPEEISDSTYFDGRLSTKGSQRSKRSFKFHDKGKYETIAKRLRSKAQLEKLQNEIAQGAKKTGIASAAKLATMQPKVDLRDGDVPEVEWWDAVILKAEKYPGPGEACTRDMFEGISNLIEHPTKAKPPAEGDKKVMKSVMLTKKEHTKMRRQNRTEAQKELQEKIRLGLMPPPEPKVRMANLMRVLGTEAVQDPTKVEAHVRAQMAKRQRGHEEANAARKLTKEQRREKKIRKIREDTSLGVQVAIYRLRQFANASKKFKVEKNAGQLLMTGIVVLHKDCNVIVVEGGPKQQRKFRRLVMCRIKWTDDSKEQGAKNQAEESDGPKKPNSCQLVWEGTVKTRAFGEMQFKTCPTPNFAREQFKKYGVEHYWDLAWSSLILEDAATEDS